MSKQIDEDEHSIEMQLPYLAHVFKERLDEVTFIPGKLVRTLYWKLYNWVLYISVIFSLISNQFWSESNFNNWNFH